MANKTRILVTGAGGFIGHHLVKRLKADGHWVRGVDIKRPEYEASAADDFQVLDLRIWENCLTATQGIDQVYNLAADMGGMGFIENNKALCMLSVLINTHLLMASKDARVDRFFFSSSACVYAAEKQT
ncbi:MAG TPA: NAD-dependent epimerase/dehydratase family protein, partial [Candidatus Acidoferrum sp.]|nr:NAD-dependent epimerase/dehydratase family protein [Candidatus Acidoferrum sp.]